MGSTSKEEQARVRSLLLDTVSLLCKNGLTHKTMKIQGLLGITINDDDVFIVHINDLVGQSETDAGKRTSERSASRESSSGKSSDKNTNRKRSSTSSPASKGPPDKRNREEVIIVDDERRRQMHDNRPIITNIRGGHTPQKHPGMRGPMMGSPNRMPFVRVIGSPNQENSSVLDADQRKIRRYGDQYSEAKKHVCDYPDCNRRYYERRHLLEHQYFKHGRPRPSRARPGHFNIAADNPKLVKSVPAELVTPENANDHLQNTESIQDVPITLTLDNIVLSNMSTKESLHVASNNETAKVQGNFALHGDMTATVNSQNNSEVLFPEVTDPLDNALEISDQRIKTHSKMFVSDLTSESESLGPEHKGAIKQEELSNEKLSPRLQDHSGKTEEEMLPSSFDVGEVTLQLISDQQYQ